RYLIALCRFFGSAYDCDEAAAVSSIRNDDDLASLAEDEGVSGDCCSENKSAFIDGLLPLPISGSCRNQNHAAIRSQELQIRMICLTIASSSYTYPVLSQIPSGVD